jgi:8-oxo-dGTP pyrophosphatase MutT (NUDIX family)
MLTVILILNDYMKYMSVAGVVFYDKDLNIAVQERGDYAKTGEKYGFWGGQVEEDETPFQAVKREMKEELGYVPELNYWSQFQYKFTDPGMYNGYEVRQYVFLSPITNKLLKAKVNEGTKVVKLPLDQVLKGGGFPTNSTNFMQGFKEKIKEI